jgi:CRISPR-associated protein (TIGR02710 family)
LATSDSTDNAERLRKGLRLPATATRVRLIESAQSLDAAYQAASEEIAAVLAEGIPPARIILHYTAGTKVMSAGAVMAAMRYEIQSLRYLFSQGRGKPSEAIATAPRSILLDQRIRLAITMVRELRFRSAIDVLRATEDANPTPAQAQRVAALRTLAQAYLEWDNFRPGEFLRRYLTISAELPALPELAEFIVPVTTLNALGSIAPTEQSDDAFPDELLFDMVNNAIRRLAERRPDDALIRLHRAAELYAQGVLAADHRIRTDDVDIRRVPPRARSAFEAERRIEDATIKLGLRKSYELLAVLGNPVGLAFQENEALRDLLRQRRHLVLGHGTRPATINQSITFLNAVEALFSLRLKDVRRRVAAQQFPWIANDDVLRRLGRAPASTESVIAEAPTPRPDSSGRRSRRKN